MRPRRALPASGTTVFSRDSPCSSSSHPNAFVWSLVEGGTEHYWLGGSQDKQSPTTPSPPAVGAGPRVNRATYANWDSGEPDDSGSGEDRLAYSATPAWHDLAFDSILSAGFIIEYSTGADALIGQSYCTPAGANSVSPTGGRLGSLSGFGTASSEVVIYDVPSQPGILYAGPTQLSLPFGCGDRCIGGSATRFTPLLPSGGIATTTVDMTVAPGLAHLQFWYRDPANAGCGSSFNLTNALALP